MRLLIVLSISFFVLGLQACGGGGSSSGGGVSNDDRIPDDIVPEDNLVPVSEQRVIAVRDSFVFRDNSPYADVLMSCLSRDPCTLQKLPFIGQTTDSPTVEDILDRVVVTHDWMGVRFGQFLDHMPAEMLSLFKPVTHIVIGSELRPSLYSRKFGRIVLDPDFLWLTRNEKKTVSTEEDFRSNFGASLSFLVRWRFRLDDNETYSHYLADESAERTIDDAKIKLASLLFHELAHASDFLPPARLGETFGALETPDSVTSETINDDQQPSHKLANDESLTGMSGVLHDLAGVRYRDEVATEYEKSLGGAEAGSLMEEQGKTTFYSFTTPEEDAANLFEAAMMKHYFNASIEIAFMDKPTGYPENENCNDYIVDWGQFNRVAAPLVMPRAEFIVGELMPSFSWQAFQNNAGNIRYLQEGMSWCVNDQATGSGGRNSGQLTYVDSHRDSKWQMEHMLEH